MSEMSYLEKLLDGVEVEWLPLGEVSALRRGRVMSKGYLTENFGPYPVYSSQTANNGKIGSINTFDFDGEYISWTTDGANAGTVFYRTGKFSITNVCGLITLKNKYPLIYKFLFYWLTIEAKKHVYSGMGNPKLMSHQVENIPVPVPCPDNPEKSLAIQSEIVRILDKFTALTAELTAELNMRKKQYNYYRDQLLSFDESSVEWKTLLEACDYVDYRGKTPKKTQSGIFLVTAKNIRMGYIDYHASQEFISEEDYAIVMRRGLPKKGDVLITTEAPCGFVAQVNRENIALAQRVIKYRSKNTQLSNSFLKHYLLGSQFQDKLMQAATGSTVKGIKGSRLHQLKIPIPSKVEQDRIVAILDKFDTLTNSITEGLPREIELRQKQYEYYRDLLFSFPTPETVSN
ncbi:TPA: restriction endonuclease subunit S [Escherichia albertii]|uniref:Restriction endonuclease subunit S n=1 Tax=Escherichia coli TaxID=562 RepID=A0AAN5UH54_ECOLX|nr:restriction endonuclease subunit S [Escherichia coli]HEB1021941.1 restriction endonuclease subunit S [Escherichia albertii]EFH5965298.1 restriction endonuclease subunit S [Escherichia coli]EFO5034767.1 restriction endonuclease subunit S [Escherichia coli]EHP7689675.1 restriction endonuclease subunit S [Escherichia coli]EHW1647744.1 restriction endonuclease subunit S [Escherichia coli]